MYSYNTFKKLFKFVTLHVISPKKIEIVESACQFPNETLTPIDNIANLQIAENLRFMKSTMDENNVEKAKGEKGSSSPARGNSSGGEAAKSPNKANGTAAAAEGEPQTPINRDGKVPSQK